MNEATIRTYWLITALSIEGEAMRGVTWVLAEEVKEGSWGIGGQSLTSDDVRRIQAGAG